jgi:hypothetical protein
MLFILVTEFENKAWNLEETFMKNKYDRLKRHLQEEFKLKAEMMKNRHAKVMLLLLNFVFRKIRRMFKQAY